MTLKERRIKTGLTQKNVAKIVEVDQTTVSLWESGKRPLLKHRVRLAKLYGCTVDELLGADRSVDTEGGT